MADKTFKELVEQLQGYLNEIAVLPKTELGRFRILKNRAARVLNRIKREYPEEKNFHMEGPAFNKPTDEGMMHTPDKE